LKILPTFKNLEACDFIQGNSILLLKHKCATDTLQETWPRLFSFAKNEPISIKEALSTPDIIHLFHFPVFEEAMVQLNLFQALLEGFVRGT
jgi:hypothetical protein